MGTATLAEWRPPISGKNGVAFGKTCGTWRMLACIQTVTDAHVSLAVLSAGGRATQHYDGGLGNSLRTPAARAVTCLRCSTCKRMSRPRSHGAISDPDTERFDEKLFVDLYELDDVRGNRYWLVAVDQHTDCTVIARCPSHESQAVANKILRHWLRWAGPPDVLVCDRERDRGAPEVFTEKL